MDKKNSTTSSTYFLDLQHLPYLQALKIMHALVDHKSRAPSLQVLMQVEHEPVITLGRRAGPDDFTVSQEYLSRKGIEVHRIERGGLATYHGPGQLVVYPIFDLRQMKLGVAQLVSGLEASVIETLKEFDIAGNCRCGYRGVWVGPEKIASIGIAVKKGICFHGIALNYAPELAHFDLIHPCGIHDVRMTSIFQLVKHPVDAARLRRTIADKIALIFDLALKNTTLDHLEKELCISF